MSRFSELRELTRGRTLLFLREPEIVFWVFAFPLILAAVLGFAFQTSEPKSSVVGLFDGPGADELQAALERVPYLEVKRYSDGSAAALHLRSGKVDALLRAGDPPNLRFDDARPDSEVARLRVSYALQLLEFDPDGTLSGPQLTLDPVSEKGSRYIDFLFPGLIGMNLMGTGMWSIGFAIAELRQRKVLKRMLVTPMRRSSLLGSLVLSRMIFLVLEVALLLAFAIFVFDVPLRSDPFTIGFLSLLGGIIFAGLGMLAVSRAKTIEGASGLINLWLMPMWLGSGVFFSYERFPEALHPFLQALPLTALNDALRGAMLDGENLIQLWPEVAVMGAWGILPFLLALKIFRWE